MREQTDLHQQHQLSESSRRMGRPVAALRLSNIEIYIESIQQFKKFETTLLEEIQAQHGAIKPV
uniref:Uncharacterized protein n=1 Tax=Arion vulgaris TaxID=1028688 RepID=A0A0B7A226_9EUPU